MCYHCDSNNTKNLEDLVGKIITSIDVNKDQTEIIFTTEDNHKYKMYHSQECCEYVYIEDICGDISDLLNSPILLAEEVSNNPTPDKLDEYDESYTWTFYKFSTMKGSVTIRWYGTSNGYYSEYVSFIQI